MEPSNFKEERHEYQSLDQDQDLFGDSIRGSGVCVYDGIGSGSTSPTLADVPLAQAGKTATS